MSINKTINATKIFDGENIVDIIGSDSDELKTSDLRVYNILEMIFMELKKINRQLSLLTNEEIEEI